MTKILASARGKPGSKCGCALEATKATVKPVAKDAPGKGDKKLPPWLNKKAG